MMALEIKLTKSVIGRNQRQRDTVKALGLGKLNSRVVKDDTPVIRGMIAKVQHLVEYKEV
ncbi:MAG: 50S ribosomal protein L30 [Candidatus Muiribacterium halophilum]|uniref:50S ribosomal protein L30 n=1 Tax=Muiribacterium halophilum TaxID=2053465 RepID=A0A2N5ZJD0_MUIH1|nr:MAG: 50S ribosomal protein L30 [Candidatus Muirbacterium halophilum]